MGETRVRHHYVPQFYLKQFSPQNSPGKVYVYTRDKDPFLTNTPSIAVINHYYTVQLEATGEMSDQIEVMFSEIEKDVAPIFRKLTKESAITLSDEEYSLLAFFIALLYNRGPAFRKKMLNIEIESRKKFIEFVAQDKRRFDAITKRAGVTFKDEEEAENTRQMWLNCDEHFTLEAEKGGIGGYGEHIKTLLEFSETLAPMIVNKKWQILQCDSSEFFITSDSPVTLISETWVPNKIGKGFLNSSVALPLTSNRCLLLTNETATRVIEIFQASRKNVLYINQNTMVHAYERLFSDIHSLGIKKAFDKTKAYQSDQTIDIKYFSK